ncbi:MAG TPA: efflux RND transporter periplasmic adaptor subunit [Gemmatimonadaceae bacterium]|nr:efflux RND transporter periplasmic adaptor subunit [Gemmatimonadaceae bacterium]
MTPLGRRRYGWAVRGGAVVASAAIVVACRGNGAARASAPAAVEVGRENVAVAAVEQLQSGPAVSGTLEARQTATLRAEVAGPVLQTYVDRGQSVRRGALLARIDDTALRQAALSAQSAARSAKLSLDNAQRNLDRSAALEKAGAIAERDLESAQSALAAAAAANEDAQARLTQARQTLDKTFVRAPFDGQVSDRQVSAGDVVQPGTALMTVIDPGSMRLEASVPSEQIAAIKRGAPVRFTVSGYPGRTFVGHIEFVSPAADPVTRQIKIDVTIPNDRSDLVAGLFAQGRVASETRTALVAPLTAVDQRGVTPAVLRVKGGRTERVAVQLGMRDDVRGVYEVTAGLSAGDTLLIGAAQGITPGTPVKILLSSDSTAAGR